MCHRRGTTRRYAAQWPVEANDAPKEPTASLLPLGSWKDSVTVVSFVLLVRDTTVSLAHLT
jgi:hypothetical protein